MDDWNLVIASWCREQPVRLCVLFGSQATGQAHPGSDVNLAIWPIEPFSTTVYLLWLHQL